MRAGGASRATGIPMLKFALPAFALGVLLAGPALADGDCATDLQKLAARRAAAMQGINEIVAAAKGKKLDPQAFCVRSRPLNGAEDAMLAYMIKNKDWCQIPDEAIANLKAAHVKSVAFGGKACSVAAQIEVMKKKAAQAQQQQQQAGGAPQAQPLPTGPL
jgi:hypothetical protein